MYEKSHPTVQKINLYEVCVIHDFMCRIDEKEQDGRSRDAFVKIQKQEKILKNRE
jgi:hypothetical protein